MLTSTQQTEAKTQHAHAWRFSVRSLILAVFFLAFILARLRWFGTDYGLAAYHPGFYGLCSVGVLLIACFQLRQASGCSSAWDLVAVAWFVAIANLFYGIFQACDKLSVHDPDGIAQVIQESVYIEIVLAVTLTVFFTVPIVYVLVFHYRSRPQSITRWIYGSLAIAVIDTVLFVILVSMMFGTWRR